MPKFDDYVNIKRETDKDLFLHNEKMRRFGSEEISSDYDLSFEQLNEHFAEREETGSFQDRTKYYFQDAEVMEAKAARYRSIANPASMRDKTDMDMFSSKYKNHSARKRKRSAGQASEAFMKAAKLENKYKGDFEQGSKATSVDKLKHRKEIMKVRLEGMTKAAAVKSTSKENENYRVLKANISCHRILREQAKELLKNETNEKQKNVLEGELSKIEEKLSEYENAMKEMIPPVSKQWEKGLGFPEELDKKTEELQAQNEDINSEDAEVLIKMRSMNSYATDQKYNDVLENLELNGMYKGYKARPGDVGRMLTAGLKTVLKDKNGLPVNKVEALKEKENQEWLDALSKGNVEKKNKVLENRFEYFMKLPIPSPEEIQKKGVDQLLKENPAEINDIMNFSLTISNLESVDPFVKEYKTDHPEIVQKLRVAVTFSTYVNRIIADKHLVGRAGDGYNIKQGVSKADSEDQSNIEDRSLDYQNFAREYNNCFVVERATSDEVEKHLNTRQKTSMDYFHNNFPDTFNGAMRKKLVAHKETELGRQLLSGEIQGDMEKSRIQQEMRKGLESFLDKRQLSIAGAIENSMFNYLKHKKVWEEKEGVKEKLPKQIDKDFFQYALDWCKDDDLITKRTDTKESYGHIVNNIVTDGNKLLEIDINRFNYGSDEEFAAKIKDNYIWLKRAESLKSAVDMAKKDNVLTTGKKMALSALEGRLDALLEVKADYDTRIAMMTSNHYVLQSQGDLDQLSDEKLQEKIDDATAEKDQELVDFLSNYKTLRDKKDSFKIGGNAKDRENALAEPRMKKEAERQEAIYLQVRKFGLFRNEGEPQKEYENRLLSTLIDKAGDSIPKEVDSKYIKDTEPRLTTLVGGLKAPDVHKLEIWFEDQMSDLKALKDKGLKDYEIDELMYIKKDLYDARRNLDLQNHIQEDLCPDWDEDNLESPIQNPYIKKEYYEAMKEPFKALFKKADTIGKTKKQKLVPLIRYINTVQKCTEIFVKHKIYFNKDVEGMEKKYQVKAQKIIQKDMEEGRKITVKMGGKDYEMIQDFGFMNECKDLIIAPDKEPLFEEKIKALQELAIKVKGCHLIDVDAKEGVYLTEIAKIKQGYTNQAIKIKEEIKRLAVNQASN